MQKKYLIAVSGGPDSMALLNKKRRSIKAVCHVNYHDREDTDNDERIVRQYCQKHHLDLYVFDTHKDDVSKYKGIKNLQKYYREIRYDFFEKIANQLNVYKIFIAHHKNDFLETAYMSIDKKKKNLFLGIRRKSKLRKLILIRPLLHKSKKSLQEYCEKNNLEFAIDYTNLADIFNRNVVRKIINQWDQKRINKFYWEIKITNLKNYFYINHLEKTFNRWVRQQLSISFFQKIKEKNLCSIIYLLLNYIGITPNENKINQIIEFINKNSNGSTKKYRIKDSQFLEVKDGRLKF